MADNEANHSTESVEMNGVAKTVVDTVKAFLGRNILIGRKRYGLEDSGGFILASGEGAETGDGAGGTEAVTAGSSSAAVAINGTPSSTKNGSFTKKTSPAVSKQNSKKLNDNNFNDLEMENKNLSNLSFNGATEQLPETSLKPFTIRQKELLSKGYHLENEYVVLIAAVGEAGEITEYIPQRLVVGWHKFIQHKMLWVDWLDCEDLIYHVDMARAVRLDGWAFKTPAIDPEDSIKSWIVFFTDKEAFADFEELMASSSFPVPKSHLNAQSDAIPEATPSSNLP